MAMATKLENQSSGHGGKRAGAGRPKGGSAADRRAFLARLKTVSEPLIDDVLEIAQSDECDNNTRLRAIQMLWDRAYGRPRVETDEIPEPTTSPAELAAALKE